VNVKVTSAGSFAAKVKLVPTGSLLNALMVAS
jgi:hypothetical protein